MEKRVELCNLGDLATVANEIEQRKRSRVCRGNLALRGDVFIDHWRDGKFLCFEKHVGKNILPTQGLNEILDVAVGAVAKESAWYVYIFKNNYTPLATNTAATSLGAAGLHGECQDADYDVPLTNRPAYTIVAAAAGVITNAASKAAFTIAASITVYGAGVCSSQAKTAVTGFLLAAKKFDVARAVIDNDVLYVTYQVTATSS